MWKDPLATSSVCGNPLSCKGWGYTGGLYSKPSILGTLVTSTQRNSKLLEVRGHNCLQQRRQPIPSSLLSRSRRVILTAQGLASAHEQVTVQSGRQHASENPEMPVTLLSSLPVPGALPPLVT